MIANLLASIVSLLPQVQDPGPGISLELARARAQMISDVRYQLTFQIDAGAGTVKGSAWVIFKLTEDHEPTAPVVLDFAGSELTDILVNDVESEGGVQWVDGHVLIPPALLHPGINGLAAKFRSPVAATGTPLNVYRDPADGREYWYTLVVPADAHRLYPCFDQPDLKASYVLTLDVPPGWAAVANGRRLEDDVEIIDGRKRLSFTKTAPISTYLMAFATGPFDVVEGPSPTAAGVDGREPLRVLVRSSQRQHLDMQAVCKLHVEGLRWLCEEFGVPYPFAKLDVVLVPGFPYGGMEHAGAIFYREQALVFDHPPTDSELVRRSTLVYHELSHQWFGNLVTMRWFDDLWLKEGFATFMSYRCLDSLEPSRHAWLRFLQGVKQRAYEVDATPGTTPVYQPLDNLADAKSAYGAIVYNKAPAVIRELHGRLGESNFKAGLQSYLRDHAFGNADWRDLARAFGSVARQDLQQWTNRWLLSPSMPQVRVEWEVDTGGLVTSFRLKQRSLGLPGTWPLRLKLAVFDLAGKMSEVEVRFDAETMAVPELVGSPAPACVLCNPDDVAYGQFLPDAVSREWLLQHAGDFESPRLRAVATASLFEAVRGVELDPARFARFTLHQLEHAVDAETQNWLLGMLGTCLQRYLPDERATSLRQAAVELLLGQLHSGTPGRELQSFRFLARISAEPRVLDLCRRVATFDSLPPGLEPGQTDRFLALAALLAAGANKDEVDVLKRHYADTDTGKDFYLAMAAAPDPATKERYWQDYLRLDAPPEQWTLDSLRFFHWPGQAEVTFPYLHLALEQLDWVKQNRKIFYMPAWLDAYLNAHDSPEAMAVVQEFLKKAQLTQDVRSKVLQSLDSLSRTVAIRAAWRE